MLSFLHKLSSQYSIARWILTRGLIRYLHPTDSQIEQMAKLKPAKGSNNERPAKDNSRGNSRYRGRKSEHRDETNGDIVRKTFKIPKNTEFVLEATKVSGLDLLDLKFYPEYQWLMDFGFCALLVYIFTEVFTYFIPKSEELNLSIVWCLLVVAFTLKMLLSLTLLYFKGDEAIGERSICITATCLFFLLSMIVLIVNENFLEFGLNPAYDSFNKSAHSFLENQKVAEAASGPMSKLIFKLCLAAWSGIVGGLFTFPGLRFAQMHKDSILMMVKNRPMQ